MTVGSTTRKAGPFLGNGVTTAFPFVFKVFTTADLALTKVSTTGVETALVLDSDYSIALNADQDNNPGGTITYPATGTVKLATGEQLVGLDVTVASQGTDLTNLGRFLPQVIEDVFDKLTILIQQLLEKVNRGLRVPASDADTPAELPAAADRAGQYLAFDAGGDPVASSGTGNDSALRTDLAASTGAGLIGWIQAGVGAVLRPLRDKVRELFTFEDFNANGDGVTDIAVNGQKAIDAAPAFSTVRLAKGNYILGAPLVGKDNVTLDLQGSKITAKDGVSFEYMLSATGKTNFHVKNGTFDANQANRVGVQAHRFMTAAFITCTGCTFENITAKNTLGFGGVPAVGLSIGGGSVNCKFITCHAEDCGIIGQASDGFFMSGDGNVGTGCTAKNVTDTAFACESSNNSGYVGCSGDTCSAVAAVACTAADKRGNFLDGITGKDWKAGVTGGVQILCSGAGNLYDTTLSNINLTAPTAGRGVGPGINVRKTSTGAAVGVLMSGGIVNTTTTQGILVDGTDVRIQGFTIKNAGASAIQFLDGSSGSVGGGSHLNSAASFGVTVQGNASVVLNGVTIATAGIGVYAINTAQVRMLSVALSGGTVGVQLENSAVARIAGSLFSVGTIGVLAKDTSNAVVSGGDIRDGTIGVQVEGSATATVNGVPFGVSSYAVYTKGTSSAVVAGGNIQGGTVGLKADDTSTLAARLVPINGVSSVRTQRAGGATLTWVGSSDGAFAFTGVVAAAPVNPLSKRVPWMDEAGNPVVVGGSTA